MAEVAKRVVATKLGEREITEDKVLNFPRGLIGFDNLREFTLIPIREDSPFLLLQSLEDPKLGLLVADPYAFIDKADYVVKMGLAEKRLLQLGDESNTAVLVTVSIPAGKPDETTLNLSGPIVLNSDIRRGLQVPQTDAKYPPHYRLGGRTEG